MNGFSQTDCGQLIMACGTGKTLTSLFIKEKLAVERLPSLSLLKQTMQEWTVNRRVPFEPLPVCSDQTVGLSDEDGRSRTPASWACRSPPIRMKSTHSCDAGRDRGWSSRPISPPVRSLPDAQVATAGSINTLRSCLAVAAMT